MDTNTFPFQFCTQLFNVFLIFKLKTKTNRTKQKQTTFSPHQLHLYLKSTYFPSVLEAGWETAKCSAPPSLATLACRQWEHHPLARTKSNSQLQFPRDSSTALAVPRPLQTLEISDLPGASLVLGLHLHAPRRGQQAPGTSQKCKERLERHRGFCRQVKSGALA